MSTSVASVREMERMAQAQISYDEINDGIRSLTMDSDEENTLLPVTREGGAQHGQPTLQTDGVARVVKIYGAIRPLLKALALMPIIPASWRSALQLFAVALDALTPAFKAGKDL
jgi:hypothetical protein